MRVLCRSIACVLAALTACPTDPVGRSFASESELLRAVGDGDIVGKLDVSYPARVVRVERGDQGLQFQHGNTAHGFPAGSGALRAVFVEHGAGSGVIVVRSHSRV